MTSPAYRHLIAAALLAASFQGCQKDDLAGTTTDTFAGKTTGILYEADGKPAVGAKVSVYPVGFRPLEDSEKASVFKTSTDNRGRYYIDSLATGEYNILGDLEGQSAYQDSIILSGTGRTLRPDTLGDPGILCGYVALEPGDPATTVTVQALGTFAYANVAADGFFALPSLAEGRYRLAVATTLGDYTTRFAEVEVHGGRRDTLADTLRPVFNGIPQVQGIAATFDTLKQQVRLTWNRPADYPSLSEYLVFRDAKGAVQLTTTPVAALRETTYVDDLAFQFGDFTGALRTAEWEYRVVIRDKFGKTGRSYGHVPVSTPSSAYAATFLEMRAANALRSGGFSSDRWQASIGDTVHLIARYSNRTRMQKLARWFLGGSTVPVQTRLLKDKEGEDTLVVVLPGSPAGFLYRVEIADAAGSEWLKTAALDAVLDAPKVEMASSVFASPGDTVRVSGKVSDTFGRLKLEWRLGGGAWSPPTANNETTWVVLESSPERTACILRATDDDGLTASDTTWIIVDPWRAAPGMSDGRIGHAAVALDGSIYVMGGMRGSSASADLITLEVPGHVWSAKPSMARARVNHAAVVADGKIYAISGHQGGAILDGVEVFDPALGAWSSAAPIPHPRTDHAAVAVRGKIYVLGGYVRLPDGGAKATDFIDVFDPVTGIWSSFQSGMAVWGALQAAVVGEAIYAFAIGPEQRGQFAKYDPFADTWTNLGFIPHEPNLGNQRPLEYSVAAHGDRIWIAGGFYPMDVFYRVPGRDFSAKVFEYLPGKKDWNGTASMPRELSGTNLVVLGDRIYAVGGFRSTTYYYNNPDYPTDKWAPTGETYFRGLPLSP